eukprot:1706062-Prymnesium_polylepis.2
MTSTARRASTQRRSPRNGSPARAACGTDLRNTPEDLECKRGRKVPRPPTPCARVLRGSAGGGGMLVACWWQQLVAAAGGGS